MFLLRILAIISFFVYLVSPALLPETADPWYNPFIIWFGLICITFFLFLPEENSQ
ncbi:hypothetical protein [Gynuella sunshinyii]|uniref:Uncharacterized protein n=1 Tax=Gynuella sunshinyii YC6258 TaxID=1445510 RepID=A0A0C5VD52_9GAMM|nr:hypothetical protein [Gynuella sunshinyii]AJQ97240.1 hypothetical Protein YC6258_05210 [Gynuella sunshinyii YC6258]